MKIMHYPLTGSIALTVFTPINRIFLPVHVLVAFILAPILMEHMEPQIDHWPVVRTNYFW